MSLNAGNRSATFAPEAVAELRHDLRTPVNHIIGYCEMLLEDAVDAGQTERTVPLEQALAAAREVLSLIGSSLPATQQQVGEEEISGLSEALRAPQSRILQATNSLMSRAGQPADTDFVADVQKVQRSAERLLAVLEPTAAIPPPLAESTAPESTSAVVDAGTDTETALILVVDDNEDNRAILQRRLERQGYAVECAENGQRALAQIRQRSFDLVLLDIMMPEVDGYEVLAQMKSAPATRDIPVIMISALDDLGSIVRCIERGAEDYLPKPFDPVLLRARISASLEKKRLRDGEVEYLRQVRSVIEAATAVEAGTYEPGSLGSIARRNDELGRLARVFDAMAGQVRAREERLHKQVHALKRAIEEAAHKPREREAHTEAELEVGQVFADRYEILTVVDGGGMGMVYKARDRELEEDMAIKTLHSDLLRGDSSLVDRFKAEIRLTRRLSHPSIVRTHDFGESDGVYYLTMEYIEGVTARKLIDTRGTLGVPSTLAIATQLAKSLAVAHEGGVIHRDIKPQNLLLDKEGELKVLDFGVARLVEHTSQRTEVGMVVGTPAYMAPEQLLEETTDERSDLYSVGVVMYECLTGRLPFEGKSAVSLIAKLLKEEPIPPAKLNDEVPPELSVLILRLLSKEPEGRPGSAAELSELLAQFA